jgi:hypothetical protein
MSPKKTTKRPAKKPATKKGAKPSVSGNGAPAQKVGWFFASNDGGEDKGLHDAGVFTFKGNIYRYLAREIIQNSLDARDSFSKPVIVTFDLEMIKRSDIPGMNQLKDICDRCRAFWPRKPEKPFFDTAVELCSESEITALKISDFNTKGVEGEDDDRLENRGWYSLIRCSGSSSKEAGEGGSYGIGKNAPFAASRLLTVLYTTRTSKKDVAFQGVARLVTHEQGPGKKAQNIGFLGGSKGQSIRNIDQIPEQFRRTQRGTDVVILGFMTGTDWENQLRLSVLENFWPAIHFGDLEVRIGDLEIDKSNLAQLLEESQKDEISAHYYYEAFTSQQSVHYTETLPNLKKVDLYLHTGETEMPKRVAMVRKSGMVIYYKRFLAAVPFCGVFLCQNDEGNARLRAMEPPKHDEWDADFPEKGANKHIEREFIDFIRQCLRNLTLKDETTVIAVPELSRFLPDDEESPEDESGAPEQSHEDKTEGFPEKPTTPTDRKEHPVSKIKKPKSNVTATDDDDDGGDDDDDGGGGGGGGNGGGGGAGDGKSDKTVVPVRFRAFPKTSDYSEYSVTVRSDSDTAKKIMLTVQVVGDDARDFVRLQQARIPGGKIVPHAAGGKVGPVTLDPNKPLRLDLKLEDSRKAALEVVAHEA